MSTWIPSVATVGLLRFALICWVAWVVVISPVVVQAGFNNRGTKQGAGATTKNEDLYKILGVSRTATVQEIKKAYRKKALDTHPDKNKNVAPEVAAESFRKVVHAFEILSDESSRRRYDQTGREDDASSSSGWGNSHGGGGNYGGFQWNFHWSYQHHRPLRMKDRFDVQKAQSRVLHVVSLAQLHTIMVDENDKLERNLLLCFVIPGKIQEIAEDEIVFPYPFADMSAQGIWWEDILQSVQVRFHKSSELSRYFGIPSAKEIKKPIFLFGKRGQMLSDPLERIETTNRQEFEMWVWRQLEVVVWFVNQHPYPVEVYWIHGSRAHDKLYLQPGTRESVTTMLSHEWYVRDARVDARHDSPGRNKLTTESSLGSWKILDDTPHQAIIIETKSCFDLSGHCGFWMMQGDCTKNPNFMKDICRLSCKVCSKEDDEVKKNDSASESRDDEL